MTILARSVAVLFAIQMYGNVMAQQTLPSEQGFGYGVYMSGLFGVGIYVDEADGIHPFRANVGVVEGVALFSHKRTTYSIGLGGVFGQQGPLLIGNAKVAWSFLRSDRMYIELGAGMLAGTGALAHYDRFGGGFNMSIAVGPKLHVGGLSVCIEAIGTVQFLTCYYGSNHTYPYSELSKSIPVSLVGIGLHIERHGRRQSKI